MLGMKKMKDYLIPEFKQTHLRDAEWDAAQEKSDPQKELSQFEAGCLEIVGKPKTRLSGNRFSMLLFHDRVEVGSSSIICLVLASFLFLLCATLSGAQNSDDSSLLKPGALPGRPLKTIIVPDYYPYTFVNEKGIPDGFSVDLAKAVAQVMGMTLEIGVDTWEHTKAALENGNIDFILQMASSPLRRQSFDFSVPYVILYDSVFVRRGTRQIGSLRDLLGKTIIIMNKDAAHDVILATPTTDTYNLIPVDSLPDGLRLLASGEGDAAIMPQLVGLLLVKKLNITNIEESPVTIESYNRPFSFAVKKGNTALVEAFNQGLSIVKATGQYHDIYEKWFGVLAPPGLPWKTVLKYIAVILGASAFVGMVLLVWSLSLKRLVKQRTETLESEISTRKKTEEALHRLNRELRAMSICNQTLIRAEDEQTLLNEICRVICDEAGYRLAWVGYAENDDAKTIRPVAWAGFDSGYVADAKLSWADDTERGRGPAGIVIRSAEIVYVQDFATDPRMVPWRENALQRGYRSGIALPLKDESAKVFGALLIYSAESRAITPDEIHLMEELAGDLEFGINGLRARTARKRAEEATRASEKKYRTLFEESFDGLFITSPGGKILDMNNKGVEMFGYDTKEEIFSLDLERDVYAHPPDRMRILSMVDARGSAEYEVVVKKKSGEEMITQCALTAVKDERGVITSYRGIIRDITELAQVRLRLENERARLRTLVQTIPDLVWLKDPDGIYLNCNPRFERFFGAKESDIVGKTDYDFVDADLADFFREHDRKAVEAGKPSINEEWITFADDGHRELLETIKTPMHDDDGRLVGVLGIARNITAAREAEEALQAASVYNRSLIEASLDPLVTIDAEGKITDVNKATERVTGYSRDELIGTDFCDYFADPQKAREGYQRAFKEGMVKDYELQIRHRDGNLTAVMYNASVYRDRSGEIVGLFAAARDISERKISEELIHVRLNLLEFAASHPLDELLQKTLDEIGALTNSPIGFYHFVESDQKTLSVQAWSTRTVKEFCKAEGKGQHYSIDRAGVWADCTRERKPVIHNDYSSLPHRKGMPEGHAAVIRELVVPIIKSGQIVAVLGIGNKPTDYTAKDTEVVSYLADVAWETTTRKRAEEGLIQSEERYRSLVENIDLGITLIDQGFNIRMVNTTMGKWFDKPVSEFTGKQCFREFEKREAVCSHCPGVRTMSTGQPAEVETQGVRDDGTRFDVRLRTFPTLGQEGVTTGFIEVVEDITERKRTEESLKERDKQYRTLFEESIDGVYSVLRDGEITDANPAFCELFGYPREEMIGRNALELYVDPADRPRFQKELEKKGFVKDYEVKFLKRDGTEGDCLVSSSVHFGKDGSIVGYRGIVQDLTARKALQRQLVQAQKMEAVGTLAGGIAHDFNNILQVVLGYAELVLADEDLPDRLRNDLGRVLQAGRNGADLVQRLLMFSRKTETKPLDLDLNQRIRQTQKFLQRTIPRMIDIELILADDLARIHVDPIQLDQVLMNLAVNARDAMPEGGKIVIETANVMIDEDYARSHLEAKPGTYVLLRVSDTGSGMDKETLDHIFEPFFTTKEAGKGTGLGLAVVYGIVTQHGGQIRCYSEPGHGTTFKIYLPALVEESDQLETATCETMPRGGTETILLVDDEEFVRDLGRRILERSGYTVLIAANGKEALDLYKREREKISLVILDLIMPGMGGTQCLEALLKIDPKARVLIASGFAANGQTKEAIETGARGFVGKPYDMKGMLQSVREVLDSD